MTYQDLQFIINILLKKNLLIIKQEIHKKNLVNSMYFATIKLI